MKNLSRVVWSEGMYLGPHHFQLQSRYFEDSIRFLTSSLWYESWGLVGASFDEEALRNGTLAMLHGRGIFPDGLTFHMPDSDPLPDARQIADVFPVARDKAVVLLGVPARRQDGMNCVPASEAARTPGVRYWSETHVLHDETTGQDEKPVELGRKNIRLLLEFEDPGEDVVTMPVARLMRDGAGNFVFDPSYIPPCLDLTASERVLTILQRLVTILEEKSKALSTGKKAGQSWAEYSTSDVGRFWMLHSIHAALPPLRHLLETRRGHPEELYRELARLGGALCTFAIDIHPREVPPYDHRALDECFGRLDEHIRRLLETIVPTSCISIPLRKEKDYFWTGEVSDQRCLDRSRWVFSIYSSAGEADIIQRTPAIVKVCSHRFVGELVKRALPGLSLTHLKIPPSAISTRADTQYFGISRSGPCWDNIVQTRQVGVYVPGDLPDPQIELLVVLES